MADVNERANANTKNKLMENLQKAEMQQKEIGDIAEARSDALKRVNSELKKHTVQLEKKAKSVSDDNILLSEQTKNLDSSKNIFSTVFETFNPKMAWRYMKMKNVLLQKMSSAIENVEIEDLENDVKITDVLGDTPKQGLLFSLQYAKIRSKLLKKISGAVDSLEIDESKSGDVLSKLFDTPKDNKLFNLQYFLFRNNLLNKVKKAVPKNFNEVDPDFVQEKLSNSLHFAENIVDSRSITEQAPIVEAQSNILQSDLKSNSPLIEILSEINENVFLIKDMLLLPKDDKKSILEEKERLREEQKHKDLISTLKGISVDRSKGGPDEEGKGLFSKLFGFLFGGKSLAKTGGTLLAIKKSAITLKTIILGVFKTLSAGIMTLGATIAKTILAISKTIGVSLTILGKAVGTAIFGIFAGISKGLLLLSNPKFLIGVTVLVGLSGAMLVAGKAFRQFSEINWTSVGIGVAVIGGLAAASLLLAKASPLIITGSLAIAALGAALIPAAFAFKIFGEAATLFSKGFSIITESIGDFILKVGNTIVNIVDSVANSIEKLANVSGASLIETAGGLVALGGALAAYAAGGAVAGAIDGISRLFGVDMVSRLEALGAVGPQLELTANSLGKVAEAFRNIGKVAGRETLNNVRDLVSEILRMRTPTGRRGRSSEFDVDGLNEVARVFAKISNSAEKVIEAFNVGYKFLTEANNFKGLDLSSVKDLNQTLNEKELNDVEQRQRTSLQQLMEKIKPALLPDVITPAELDSVNIGSEIMREEERRPTQAEQIGRVVSESTTNVASTLTNAITTISSGGNVTSNYYQNTNIDYTKEKSVAGNMW